MMSDDSYTSMIKKSPRDILWTSMRLTIFWGPALPGAVAPVPSDPVPFPAISAPPMGPSTGSDHFHGSSRKTICVRVSKQSWHATKSGLMEKEMKKWGVISDGIKSHPGCYRSYRALSSFANRTAERPRRYQQHEAQRQITGIMWSLLKTKNWYKLRYYPAILRPTLPRWAEGPFHAVYNGSSEIHKRKSHGIWNI